MKFLTDDGRFGFRIARFPDYGMFRFQLVIDGRLIGDTESCFVNAGLAELGELPHLDDERLGRLRSEPEIVLSALLTEEELHDKTTLHLAESLDQWLIHGYVYQGDVVMIARRYEEGSPTGPMSISVIGYAEYIPLFEATRDYWLKTNAISQ